MRIIATIIALTCMFYAHPATARDPVQSYMQGQVLEFSRASSRFLCKVDKTILDFVVNVRNRFKGIEGVRLLFRPLTRNHRGTLVIKPDISNTLPITTSAVVRDCKQAPGELIVMGALHYVQITDQDDAVIALVADSKRRLWFTYFLNVRVTTPMPGSEAGKHFGAVLRAVAPHNTLRKY